VGALIVALGFIASKKLFVVPIDNDLKRSIAGLPLNT
jgi:hypothetical protein